MRRPFPDGSGAWPRWRSRRRGWIVLQILAVVAFLGVVSLGILAQVDCLRNRSRIPVLADFEVVARASAIGRVDSEMRECNEEKPRWVPATNSVTTSGSRYDPPFGARPPDAGRGIYPLPLWDLEPWIPQGPYSNDGRNRYVYTEGSGVLSCETWGMIFFGSI